MTLKNALWASAAWTVLVVGATASTIWYVVTHRLPGVSSNARAARAGSGMGIAAGIGYGCIWLPYAAAGGGETACTVALTAVLFDVFVAYVVRIQTS